MSAVSQARKLWRRLTGSREKTVAPHDWIDTITTEWKGVVNVIPCNRIILIEAQGENVSIATAEGTYLKLGTIGDFEHKLNPAIFLRIHRSTIVNKTKIDRVSRLNEGRTNFHMSNDRVVGASQAYQDEINKALPNLAKKA